MKIAAAVCVAALLDGAALSRAAEPAKPPPNEDCLTCHAEADAKASDGRSVFLAREKFESSIHGEAGLACVDCHADLAKATELPHAEKLAPAQCASCHAEVVSDYGKSVHAEARRRDGASLAAACADCHGTHDIRPSNDPASPTYALNLPATCANCHGDPDVIRAGHIAIGDVATLYKDSIHGRAVLKSGLVTAPNCKTCHGMHDIRRAADPAARVFRGNIPANCGTCHQGIVRLYEEGIHGTRFRGGVERAPVCTDCHTAHDIRQVEAEGWRLEVLRECGSCHVESQETFRDTYHGQVTNLGFSRIATCSDCHRAHDIFPAADARSAVSAAGRVATCQTCHPGTNEKFALYDPHPDPKDRARNPLLFYTAIFMKWLVIGVMAFFGLHTVLWFPRSWRARREGNGSEPPAREGGKR
jgi:hypothetical protein